MADFAAVRGLRIDLATGHASLLLARPSAMAPPLFSLEAGPSGSHQRMRWKIVETFEKGKGSQPQ